VSEVKEQLTLPAVESAKSVVVVTVSHAHHRLAVDRDDWDAMNDDERHDYVYDAAEELGWIEVSYALETPTIP
jgi:hypothetical protein